MSDRTIQDSLGKICMTCEHCKYIKTPNITGNDVDFICEMRGSVINNIKIKECDTMYKRKRFAHQVLGGE